MWEEKKEAHDLLVVRGSSFVAPLSQVWRELGPEPRKVMVSWDERDFHTTTMRAKQIQLSVLQTKWCARVLKGGDALHTKLLLLKQHEIKNCNCRYCEECLRLMLVYYSDDGIGLDFHDWRLGIWSRWWEWTTHHSLSHRRTPSKEKCKTSTSQRNKVTSPSTYLTCLCRNNQRPPLSWNSTSAYPSIQ